MVQARLGTQVGSRALDTYGHLRPDADKQTRNILNEALTGLQKGGSRLGVLETTQPSCVLNA